VSISSGSSSFTYLGVFHPPSGVIIYIILHHKLPSSHLFFSILPCAIYITCLCSCLCHFLLVIFIHPLLPLFLISAPCITITLFLCFSLYPFEVNLHTYLTTWLSSCLVGIFLGFSPQIANLKIINKSNQLKSAILNSTHIMWYSEHGYLVLICFELISDL